MRNRMNKWRGWLGAGISCGHPSSYTLYCATLTRAGKLVRKKLGFFYISYKPKNLKVQILGFLFAVHNTNQMQYIIVISEFWCHVIRQKQRCDMKNGVSPIGNSSWVLKFVFHLLCTPKPKNLKTFPQNLGFFQLYLNPDLMNWKMTHSLLLPWKTIIPISVFLCHFIFQLGGHTVQMTDGWAGPIMQLIRTTT